MNKFFRLSRPLILFGILVAGFFACHLSTKPGTEKTFTFTTLRDSIGNADYVVIQLKDSTGRVIDVLFDGPVDGKTSFKELPAPHYDGERVILFIEARKDDVVIYKVERGFDESKGGDQERIIHVSRSGSIDIRWANPGMREGETRKLPDVEISPAGLSDPSILWSAGPSNILAIQGDSLTAVGRGHAYLKAMLKSDATKWDSLSFEVIPKVVDSPGVLKPNSPRLTPLRSVSVLTIQDSIAFEADASMDSGVLQSAAWDYDGDGKSDDSLRISGKSMPLKGGYRYRTRGKYIVTLRVRSEADSVSQVQKTVDVRQDIPSADAGKDTTVYPGRAVRLRGKGVDTLGTVVKTEWKIGAGPYLPAGSDTTLTAPSTLQDIEAVFRVTDDDGQSAADTVMIHIVSESESNLTGLEVSSGTLSPQFNPAVLSYADTVPFDVASIRITPRGTGATTVNSVAVADGEASKPIELKVGATVILITVQLQGTAGKTYTLDVFRPKASSNANLSGLISSAGAFDIPFSSGDTLYNVFAPHAMTATTVTATLANSSSTLSINGISTASGSVSGAINLQVGVNTIRVAVTAQNGDRKVYTIQVTRAGNGSAALSALVLSAGSLNPAFSSGVIAYSLTVPNTVASTHITATVAQATSTLAINGQATGSGVPRTVDLVVGSNTIVVQVTALSGDKQNYTVQVTRAGDGNTNLSELSLSAGSISPAFSATTAFYTLSVAHQVASTTVTARGAGSTSAITVNGNSVASGVASGEIALVAGLNTITVVVTAQNGDKNTYSILVTRAGNPNADLSALSLSAGTISPAFSSSVLNYSLSVANGVASTKVTPTVAVGTSTVTVNDVQVASGEASGAIPLGVGENTLNVVVAAQSGATKTYSIVITRAGDGNADLSGLTLSAGSISPAFASATTAYSLSVANSITSTTVTPLLAVGISTIAVNGSPVASGAASGTIPLAVGENILDVVVTAQNGTTKSYTVVVTRTGNGDASLSSLAVSAGSLSPAFVAGNSAYTVSAAHSMTSTTITPVVSAGTSSIAVNGTAVSSGAVSEAIILNVGSNPITIVVTAQDASTRTYTVAVTRASDANADLSNLVLSSGPFSPAFLVGTTSYSLSVDNNVTSTTVTPTAASGTATVTVNGTGVASGSASGNLALNVGANFISVVVTAQNGGTRNYTVVVTRAASGNADLSALSVSAGAMVPTFDPAKTAYSLIVANGVSHTTVSASRADGTAGLAINPVSPVSLSVGANSIAVTVTAQNGATKIYTIQIKRALAVSNIWASINSSSMFLTPEGHVFAAGRNNSGQLGDGTSVDRTVPVLVMTGVSSVSAGSTFTLFLKSDGTAWGVGGNSFGQLGDNSATSRATPLQIMAGVKAVTASSGESSFFVLDDGTVMAAGNNGSRQLGDGTNDSRRIPVQVLNGVSKVAAGTTHTLFLKSDGTVWACGNNSSGQLGNGSNTTSPIPVQVMTDVADIAAGEGHSLFLKKDGNLMGAGSNGVGQLGDGTTTARPTPILISSNVSKISAGELHSLFLKKDGVLWACGRGLEGQLGDGTSLNRATPVSPMSSVSTIAAGSGHTLIRRTDGSIWATGTNSVGEFGDGTENVTQPSPVLIQF